MPRLSRHDLDSLAVVESNLHRVGSGAEAAFRTALARVQELTDALAAGLVLVDTLDGEEARFVEGKCLGKGPPGRWLGQIDHAERQGREGRLHVARAILADGPVVFGILGLIGARPFAPKHAQLLARMVPAFHHRARIERLLRGRCFSRAALSAALAEVDGPAILLSARGGVELANRTGQERLTTGGSAFRESLRAATRAGAELTMPLLVHRIGGVMRTEGFLVVERQVESAAGAPEPSWKLSPRQRAVVDLVAQGLTNRQIAHALGIGERTVETHLTAVFVRARVASRSELIARLLGR